MFSVDENLLTVVVIIIITTTINNNDDVTLYFLTKIRDNYLAW